MTSKDQKTQVKGDEKDAAAGNAEVQEKVDSEEEKGYRGVAVDPTPNEHYTVAGVTAGKPTPETDPDAAAKAGAPSLLRGRFDAV